MYILIIYLSFSKLFVDDTMIYAHPYNATVEANLL